MPPTRAVEDPSPASSTESRSIHGVVVDPAGAAIAGASVQAVEWTGGVPASTTTDARGAFALEGFPRSTPLLHVSAVGRCARFVTLEAPNIYFEHVADPARIVLEGGSVAVARLRWTDGAPCVGVAVHLSRFDGDGRVHGDPDCGLWPPPKTDADGLVVLGGLPPDRVLLLGVDLYGGDRDRMHPLATGSAATRDAAVEQCFTFARAAELSVVLTGLEELARTRTPARVRVQHLDGSEIFESFSVPPTPCVFEHLVLGGLYAISFSCSGSLRVVLADHLRITEADQRVEFACTSPPRAPPQAEEPRWEASFVLHDVNGAAITRQQLVERGIWPSLLRLRYRGTDPRRRDEPPRVTTCLVDDDPRQGVGATVWLGVAPPLQVEATLLDQHAHVDVDESGATTFELRFDLARLASATGMVTFRARDERGRELHLDSVWLTKADSPETLDAIVGSGGEIARAVPIGRWRCRGCSADRVTAIEEIAVDDTSPRTIDLKLLDLGAIRGRVTPPPTAGTDVRRIDVTRSPVDRMRTLLDWWSGCVVAPDGSFELRAVPPGEWCVFVQTTALDGKSIHVESTTVSVKAGAVAQLDLACSSARATRYRFDLGSCESALVHAVDERGRTAFDAHVRPEIVYELSPGALAFHGAAEVSDDASTGFDFSHWIDGVTAPDDPAAPDSVTVVRFAFPPR